MSTTPITFRIDKSMKAELEVCAKDTGRSVSNIVQLAIANMLRARQQRIAAIEVAIDQMEGGETVPYEDVRKWLRSLSTDNPLPRPHSSHYP